MPETSNPLINNENTTPDRVNELLSSLELKEQQQHQKDPQIDQLLTMIHLLRQKRFGRSSEAFNPDQLQIFDETQLDELLKLDGSVDEPATVVAEPTMTDKAKQKPRPASPITGNLQTR